MLCLANTLTFNSLGHATNLPHICFLNLCTSLSNPPKKTMGYVIGQTNEFSKYAGPFKQLNIQVSLKILNDELTYGISEINLDLSKMMHRPPTEILKQRYLKT